MSVPQKPWEGGSSRLSLANTAAMPFIAEPKSSYIHSVPGTSTSAPLGAPTLPPRPQTSTNMSPYGLNSGYGSYGGMGTMGLYGMGGMGAYGGGYGPGGYMGGMGGMGAPYGGYNRFGGPMDLESRFIQMAEESSRPAFESIGGVVQAIGSVAMMLDNTFLALTSSFRAILGVAENFGRLRSLFAQVWSSLAVIRSLDWIIRKLLVVLGIRTQSEFKAWAAAVAETQNEAGTPEQRRRASSWPVLVFFGVLAAAPYVILRVMKGVAGTLHERLTDPTTWERPLRAVALHDFTATSPQEVSFRAEQVLMLAPEHLQGNLWNSGWLMASMDHQTAGLVPVNYIKVIRPTPPSVETRQTTAMMKKETEYSTATEKKENDRQPNVDLDKIYDQEL